MDQAKTTAAVTVLLTALAGYCDTATFVAGDAIFSAHVTGNFILLAAQLMGNHAPMAWVKLLTFPVFVTAVIAGGWINNRKRLILWESLLLLAAGGMAVCCPFFEHAAKEVQYTIVMMVVLAMGLQNAFGRLFPQEAYGPTTMMTGNVTQFSLDLGRLFRQMPAVTAGASFRKMLLTIAGFLAGCILGALAARSLGLVSILFPGVALVVCYLLCGPDTDAAA